MLVGAVPESDKASSPVIKSASLKKDYPKREILKNKLGSFSHVDKLEWERIKERAKLIRENLGDPAA